MSDRYVSGVTVNGRCVSGVCVCVCVKVVCECVGGIGSDNKISNPCETCKNHMNQVPRPGISFIQYGRVTRRLQTHASLNKNTLLTLINDIDQ